MEVRSKRLIASIHSVEVDDELSMSLRSQLEADHDISNYYLETLISSVNGSIDVELVVLFHYGVIILEIFSKHKELENSFSQISILYKWYNLAIKHIDTPLLELQRVLHRFFTVLFRIDSCYLSSFVSEYLEQSQPHTNRLMLKLIKPNAGKEEEFYDTINNFLSHKVLHTQRNAILTLGLIVRENGSCANSLVKSNAWKSLVHLLMSSNDMASITLGIWVLVTVIPNIRQTIFPHLQDLLKIFRRALLFVDCSTAFPHLIQSDVIIYDNYVPSFNTMRGYTSFGENTLASSALRDDCTHEDTTEYDEENFLTSIRNKSSIFLPYIGDSSRNCGQAIDSFIENKFHELGSSREFAIDLCSSMYYVPSKTSKDLASITSMHSSVTTLKEEEISISNLTFTGISTQVQNTTYDFDDCIRNETSRIRQIVCWFGYGAHGSIGGFERLTGLQITCQTASGSIRTLPIRGSKGMYKRTYAFRRGEYLLSMEFSRCPVNASSPSSYRMNRDMPNSVTIQSPVSAEGVIVVALRPTTNRMKYPWIGLPSRQVQFDTFIKGNLDKNFVNNGRERRKSLDEEIDETKEEDNEAHELVGFYGTFDDNGIRFIGGIFTKHGSDRWKSIIGDDPLKSPAPDFYRYLAFFFRFLYTLFPWECINFFHKACSDHPIRLVLGTLLMHERLHPGILISSSKNKKYTPCNIASSSELYEISDWLQYEGTKSGSTLLHEDFRASDLLESERGNLKPNQTITHFPNSPWITSDDYPQLSTSFVIANMLQAELTFEKDRYLQCQIASCKLRSELMMTKSMEAELSWLRKELSYHQETNKRLQESVDRYRYQIQSYEREQKKWQHELQLRITKYAHDRKGLSEQTIQLQDQVTMLETELRSCERALHVQTATTLELESEVSNALLESRNSKQIQQKNEMLTAEIKRWEFFHTQEIKRATSAILQEKDILIEFLEHRLLNHEGSKIFSQDAVIDKTDRNKEYDNALKNRQDEFARLEELEIMVKNLKYQVAELESSCRQKEQINTMLRNQLDAQQHVFDEKVKAVSDKYDHIKAINLVLQKKVAKLLLIREKSIVDTSEDLK